MSPFIAVSKKFSFYPDGFTRKEYEAGETVEVEANTAAYATGQGFAEIVAPPGTEEGGDNDPDTSGDGDAGGQAGSESGGGSDDVGGSGVATGEAEGGEGAGGDAGSNGGGEEDPPVFKATPGAVDAAAELGVDLAEVTGTGKEGMILVGDVQRRAEAEKKA